MNFILSAKTTIYFLSIADLEALIDKKVEEKIRATGMFVCIFCFSNSLTFTFYLI